MGNLDRTLQPIPAAVNRHYHRQPEQLEFAAARGKANHQASGLWAVVCGDGSTGRAHAPPDLRDVVCRLCALSVRSSQSKLYRRSSRSI